MLVFFVKQKTAYELRISDWSSHVCSSDLLPRRARLARQAQDGAAQLLRLRVQDRGALDRSQHIVLPHAQGAGLRRTAAHFGGHLRRQGNRAVPPGGCRRAARQGAIQRSEEHTSELQSLMRISYAVFCLKKTKNNTTAQPTNIYTTTA